MSLRRRLTDGDLGRWCARELGDRQGRDALRDDVMERLRGRRPVRPARCGRAGGSDVRHPAVALALRQRLAFAVQPAPPYRALVAAVATGTAGGPTAHATAAAFPTHRRLGPRRLARALDWRPTPAGWVDLAGAGPAPEATDGVRADARSAPRADVVAAADRAGREPRLVADLGDRLVGLLDTVVPARLGDDAVESAFAEACLLLSTWHRRGATPRRGSSPEPEVPPLRDELVELALLARDTGTLTTFHELAGRPAAEAPVGVASPTLVPGWAEGDLLLAGEGTSTLVAVRTPDDVGDGELVHRWCHELLAGAWIGVRGAGPVDRVGLHLGRHGVLVLWDTATLAATLAGVAPDDRDAIDAVARRFRVLARTAVADDGGDARWVAEPVTVHASGRPPVGVGG